MYSYSNDYADLRLFKSFAEEHHVALILVHHLRKARDDGNVYNGISGSNGVTGAVDAMMVLDRNRGSDESILHVTGRDVSDSELAITMDKETMRWECLGDAEILKQEREKQEFLNDPVVQTVYELVRNSQNQTWSGKSSDLIAADTSNRLGAFTAQQVGYKLTQSHHNFQRYLGIDCRAISDGNAGKRYEFRPCVTVASPIDETNTN